MDPILQAFIDSLNALQAQLADVTAFAKAQYDKGFADGVASVGSDPEKKFTQADIDAAVSAAVGPLMDQIAALQAQVSGLPQAVADAVSAVKADLAVKYADLEAALQASEAGFAELLK